MSNHTQLRVWQQAQELVVDLADAILPSASRRMPGLRNQLLRAAASISAAIAEGASQSTPANYARYLSMAIGSASETESHLTLAIKLGVVRANGAELLATTIRIRKMLFRLRDAVLSAKANIGTSNP